MKKFIIAIILSTMSTMAFANCERSATGHVLVKYKVNGGASQAFEVESVTSSGKHKDSPCARSEKKHSIAKSAVNKAVSNMQKNMANGSYRQSIVDQLCKVKRISKGRMLSGDFYFKLKTIPKDYSGAYEIKVGDLNGLSCK